MNNIPDLLPCFCILDKTNLSTKNVKETFKTANALRLTSKDLQKIISTPFFSNWLIKLINFRVIFPYDLTDDFNQYVKRLRFSKCSIHHFEEENKNIIYYSQVNQFSVLKNGMSFSAIKRGEAPIDFIIPLFQGIARHQSRCVIADSKKHIVIQPSPCQPFHIFSTTGKFVRSIDLKNIYQVFFFRENLCFFGLQEFTMVNLVSNVEKTTHKIFGALAFGQEYILGVNKKGKTYDFYAVKNETENPLTLKWDQEFEGSYFLLACESEFLFFRKTCNFIDFHKISIDKDKINISPLIYVQVTHRAKGLFLKNNHLFFYLQNIGDEYELHMTHLKTGVSTRLGLTKGQFTEDYFKPEFHSKDPFQVSFLSANSKAIYKTVINF